MPRRLPIIAYHIVFGAIASGSRMTRVAHGRSTYGPRNCNDLVRQNRSERVMSRHPRKKQKRHAMKEGLLTRRSVFQVCKPAGRPRIRRDCISTWLGRLCRSNHARSRACRGCPTGSARRKNCRAPQASGISALENGSNASPCVFRARRRISAQSVGEGRVESLSSHAR